MKLKTETVYAIIFALLLVLYIIVDVVREHKDYDQGYADGADAAAADYSGALEYYKEDHPCIYDMDVYEIVEYLYGHYEDAEIEKARSDYAARWGT